MQLKHFASLIFMIGFAFRLFNINLQIFDCSKKALKGPFSEVILNNPFLTLRIMSDVTCQLSSLVRLSHTALLKSSHL